MNEFWQLKNQSGDNPEILLYGEITGEAWGDNDITPKKFVDDLKTLGGRNITIRINSPGGDVFAAQAIYNQLLTYTGNKTVRIDGICASAATIIASAGDTVIMPDNAIYMIHNPKSALCGYYDENAAEQLKSRLEAVKQTIVNVYFKRCGGKLSEETIKDLMSAETWMSAQDALEYGFINQIDDAQIENRIDDGILIVNQIKCDLSQFKNTKKLHDIVKNKTRSEAHVNKAEELLAQIINLVTGTKDKGNEGVIQIERQRIADLDALNQKDNPIINQIIAVAKKDGKSAADIKPYIDAVMNVEPPENPALKAIKDLIADNLESGGQHVASNSSANNPAATNQLEAEKIINLINKQRGV